MKVRRKLTVVIAACILLSAMVGENALASFQRIAVNQDYQIMSTEKISVSIPANTAVQIKTGFSLEVGESVTIKASYSPFTASLQYGLMGSDHLFYGYSSSDGKIDDVLTVAQAGVYYVVLKNNSSVPVSVTGYINY